MLTPALEEAQRLLRLARRDLSTVRLLVPLPQASLAAIGFHAQQSTEKALKAVCTLRQLEFRRTHDLFVLGHLLVTNGSALPVTLEQLRTLNPFAVEFRYDDEVAPDLSRDETMAIAEHVLAWASTQVSEA